MRRKWGLTEDQLAALSGVSRSAIGFACRAERPSLPEGLLDWIKREKPKINLEALVDQHQQAHRKWCGEVDKYYRDQQGRERLLEPEAEEALAELYAA